MREQRTPVIPGMTPLERIFRAEKLSRDDTSHYVGELLIRQRRVNHSVLAFNREFLPTGSLVVDACAGPEGSLLPALHYQYQWVGNEISPRFARNLKRTGADNVVISDFARPPFGGSIVDGVFFIFALNNINRPGQAIIEAGRITRKNGVIVIADPGPSVWQTNILLSRLIPEEMAVRFIGASCSQELASYFDEKPYSREEYCQFFAQHSLGATDSQLREYVQAVLAKNGQTRRGERSISFYFQQMIAARYYSHLVRQAAGSGFGIRKIGIMTVARPRQEGTEWLVNDPIRVKENLWMEALAEARKGKGDLVPPEMVKSQCRLVFPVICLKR